MVVIVRCCDSTTPVFSSASVHMWVPGGRRVGWNEGGVGHKNVP